MGTFSSIFICYIFIRKMRVFIYNIPKELETNNQTEMNI